MPDQTYLDTRIAESAEATEVFVTATPAAPGAPRDQAEALFTAVRDVLDKTGGRILQERIFASEAALEAIAPVRARIYGALDDGVAPGYLVPDGAPYGAFAGVQVHAVRSAVVPKPLRSDQGAYGRVYERDGYRYAALTGVAAPEGDTPSDQAAAMLEKSRRALDHLGGDMFAIARTWMWLAGILDWYDDFNTVRTGFFRKHGLIPETPGEGQQRLPASTGIGVGPPGRARCSMDLIAVLQPPKTIRYHGAAGHQNPAYRYGSAFSRAASAATPAGQTVYVSGTAAIDAQGVTEHIGNAPAQIQDTLSHVRAVLADMGCGDADVVQAIAYSKTPAVQDVFLEMKEDAPWPWLPMVSDVCRDNLLFEVEAAAFPGARRL